jgi:DNA polymerase II large subunit
MVLKAPKILKYVKELNLDGWGWLEEFVVDKEEGKKTIEPSYKYLHDVLAGRPIFSQPMKVGGFRLRYGRGRLSGLATTSIHPATMKALSGFLITGTQMKYELPGKATVVTPCTTIDGPYIQFKDGSAKRIQDEKEILDGLPIDIDWPIAKIWDLGEILIPFGEFLENNHQLLPSPYVKEWHDQITPNYPLNFSEALTQCRKYQIPMAPEYVAMFNDLSAVELKELYDGVITSVCGNYIEIPESLLELIYRLNINVSIYNGAYVLEGDKASVFTNSLMNGRKFTGDINQFENGLYFLNHIMDYEIKPPVTYRIGGRMGKPEGAKLRQMKPPIHVMFPLGSEVGSQRKITDAIKKNNKIEIGKRLCKRCNKETILGVCCGENTIFDEISYENINLQSLWNEAKMDAGIFNNLDVKGVKGMTSSEKCPENLMKGLLRLNHEISTFRDGTIRFDMVDISMTHFKPVEIGLSVSKAQKLGYEVENENEIVELYPQDIVISKTCAQTILKTSQYIDDLLVKLYDLPPHYNAHKVEDLFGHLFMGLAPHTSGAILCRLIGVAEIKGHYGHPFFHAAKRRNCDGDIDSIMLLMDGLINFSKLFLSTHRGGNMDAPLILTTQINPSEIDKEALNLDVNTTYPKEFYELTQKSAHPKVALKGQISTVGGLLGTSKEFRGFGYTHDTKNCSDGPKNNPYNTLDSMRQKTLVQFALGQTLYCVDNEDQSSRLIDRHLIRDMRGNLRAFGQQKVRCTVCGTKYRRPPISGNCNKVVENKKDPFTGQKVEVVCPGNIILTVTQGGINKYGGLMGELVEKYGCNEYTEQLYELVSDWVSETFRNEDEKEQSKLW